MNLNLSLSWWCIKNDTPPLSLIFTHCGRNRTTVPIWVSSSRTIVFITVGLLISCAPAYSAANAWIDTRVHKAEFTIAAPAKLFSNVFAGRLAKSEFETEAQYRSRLEQMRPLGTFFLLIPSTSVRYVYRAELQRLVVMAPQVGSAITVASSSRDL